MRACCVVAVGNVGTDRWSARHHGIMSMCCTNPSWHVHVLYKTNPCAVQTHHGMLMCCTKPIHVLYKNNPCAVQTHPGMFYVLYKTNPCAVQTHHGMSMCCTKPIHVLYKPIMACPCAVQTIASDVCGPFDTNVNKPTHAKTARDTICLTEKFGLPGASVGLGSPLDR